MNNQHSNSIIPIPTETAVFSDDGVIDDEKKWRWWFTFPDTWTTSNVGEKILGIRNIWLNQSRRKLQYTLKLHKYLYYDNGAGAAEIYEPSENYMEVKITSWLPIEKDLREIYIDVIAHLREAIIENEKYKDPEQISFEMPGSPTTSRDFQMDGVFEPYMNRVSFVEKMYCRDTHDYPVVQIETPGGETLNCFTMCKFSISDYNDDFKLVFNLMTDEEVEQGIYRPGEKNLFPRDTFVTDFSFYDVWDRHSCKLFSSFAADSNRGYIGNSTVDMIPIKYFKLNSTDKKFYIDFYNSRNINCPSVIPYQNSPGGQKLMNEQFLMEIQLMQNDKLLYI